MQYAIISDVDMPVMNGIEFYTHATTMDPTVGARFLFYTGSTDHIDFFKEYNVRYLTKPIPINQITKALSTIINR